MVQLHNNPQATNDKTFLILVIFSTKFPAVPCYRIMYTLVVDSIQGMYFGGKCDHTLNTKSKYKCEMIYDIQNITLHYYVEHTEVILFGVITTKPIAPA